MSKLIITSNEELQTLIDKSNKKYFDGLREFITKKINPPKPNYTVKDLSKLLNVTELTVRNYISKGYIKADKIGRRIVISKENLDAALSEVKSLKYKRS